MRKALGGYTIIEVLVVLAVSGVILASAIIIVGGLQPQTQFSQSAFDMQSKIESVIRGTGNTLFPNVEKYDCTTGGNARPRLVAASGGSHTAGTSQACIFLGRAIRLDVGSGKLYIYSVLGNRTITVGGITKSVNNLADARPTTPVRVGFNLTETYDNNANYLRLKSAVGDTLTGNNQPITLGGYYTNLSDTSSSPGQQSSFTLLTMAYDLPASPNDNSVKNCIESGCGQRKLSKWNLCFENLDGNRTALLSIVNNSSGATTKLKFNGC
jgi:prepilin-type N-terminal cleavage/methylation domain-containing protein